MADKKISIFVEAAVAGAKRKLKELEDSLGRLGKTTSTTATSVSGGMGRMEQAATVLEGAFKKLAVVGAAYLAKMAAEHIVQYSRMAAKNLELEESYERVAARYGMASDAILAALDKAAKGTIDKFSLMLEANKAMRLGVATTVEEFGDLMKIAVVRAKEFGTSTAQAWDTLINAIGRAEPAFAKNIGFMLDANALYAEHAQSIDKVASGLTDLERREAIRNEILRQGLPDMEAWNDMGVTAADVFQQYDATMVELRQELGEKFLPVVVGATQELLEFVKGAETAEQATRDLTVEVIASAGSFGDAARRLEELNRQVEAGGRWAREGAKDYSTFRTQLEGWEPILRAVDEGIREDVRAMELGEKALVGIGATTQDTAADQEELDTALQKGADVWADYGRRVEEANYQFARSVEDAQFRATQALEDAAFRRYEIERNAGERRGDILTQYDIRLEAATATHYNRLRYMRQDLLDELSDMDWEHEQDRAEMMKRAPWWIRQALQKEFSERERIAKTGDSKALRDYDKALKERIRAIDPIYAEELDLLDEHYEHQADVEKREAGQGQQRQADDWDIRNREQRRSLDEQLRQLDQNLGDQLGAWYFHEGQREEAERRSMGRMHDEHDHALAAMYDNTIRRLEAITPIWEAYGYEWGMALLKGMAKATPWTAVEPGYVPDWTNPFAGGASPNFSAAASVAGGATTTNNVTVNVGGGWTPYQGQEVATQVATKLGQMTVRQKR